MSFVESKTIKLDRKAEKELARLFHGNKNIYLKVKEELSVLSSNPFKGKVLHGDKKGCHRLRIGDYRIIYEVAGNEIWILKIGHRKDIYR